MTLLQTPIAAQHCAQCPLASRAICRAVSAAAAATGGRQGPRLRRFPADWVLREDGETPKLTGILRRGYLRTERILEDGRRSIVDLAVPSDLVGIRMDDAYSGTVAAATDVEICTFDPQLLRSLKARDPKLRLDILRATARRHARQLDLVWRRGALNSRERIIAFLTMAAEIMPSEPLPDGSLVLSMPISRRDWADLTNTTVETICRTLGQLVAQGHLQSLAPARYRIKDLAALSELAGLDPQLDGMAKGAPRSDMAASAGGRSSHRMPGQIGAASLAGGVRPGVPKVQMAQGIVAH